MRGGGGIGGKYCDRWKSGKDGDADGGGGEDRGEGGARDRGGERTGERREPEASARATNGVHGRTRACAHAPTDELKGAQNAPPPPHPPTHPPTHIPAHGRAHARTHRTWMRRPSSSSQPRRCLICRARPGRPDSDGPTRMDRLGSTGRAGTAQAGRLFACRPFGPRTALGRPGRSG